MNGSRIRRLAVATLAIVAAAAWQASAAFGADSVYWTSTGPAIGAIGVGNLDGTGSPSSFFAGETSPWGVAIDPAAGKIYWASNVTAGAIRVGNLDGTGTAQSLFGGQSNPTGVALDPAAGKIYWAASGGAIRVGNLDGSGSPQTLFMGEGDPEGLAIDPAGGKLYWADFVSGAIRVGSLNGAGSPQTLFMGESEPSGVAIDPAAGKIYWANQTASGAIRVGNLAGGGSPQSLFTAESFPVGVAIDPAAGKIYWSNGSTMRVGNLAGGGLPQNLHAGSNPNFLALLRAPAGAGAPQIAGGSTVGSVLSCSRGSWASDLLGALLYRAPRSFAYEWSLNGSDIAGATSSSFAATAPGSYACRVTATNQAGSTLQTSASHAVSGTALRPRLTSVSQSHRRWREGSALPQIASAKRLLVGTAFHFTLNEVARVQLRFTKAGRTVAAGGFAFTAGSGAHKVRFQGRISKHKKLKLGRYTLLITATNSAGQRATAKLTFTIAM